ncbi:MAG: dihydroorotase [Pseudomonadales bacterium]|nr:dihydroorotase [Pseudomonadales bacterium]
MRNITLTRPDDWHVHLRDDEYLRRTITDSARYFGRAIVMPNLVPAIDNVQAATEYHQRIVANIPDGSAFKPLMTLYITQNTRPETIIEASESGLIHAFKLYPAGATTNSEAGIEAIESLYPIFETMQKANMPLCVHGEVTTETVDIYDREAVFIESYLKPVCAAFPALKVILEHITTSEAVDFVLKANDQVAATITAHHLLFNRNHMLVGGLKPLYYCLPVLKRNIHQNALIKAATSGNSKFFLGTDSAPHPKSAKENACGCAAGSYTAHAAIELYAEVFDKVNALDKLEGFSSFFGADFYGLPRNPDRITLSQESWSGPDRLQFGNDWLIPIRNGETITWKVKP